MKILLTLLTIIAISFTITACEQNEKKSEKLTPLNTESPLVIHKDKEPTPEQEKQKILDKIGISADKGKIVIDTKKTKDFLDNMAKTLAKEGKKFEEKTKNIDSDDLGIKVNNEKIEIDMKKTKNFLEEFSKELENIAKDMDKELNK